MGVLVPDVFHLALTADWEAARPRGSYAMSTLGLTVAEVGFLHLSFAWQVEAMARRFYAAVTEPLVLLRVDSSVLSLVLEPIETGEHFPHLYGELPVAAVTETRPFLELTLPAEWAV